MSPIYPHLFQPLDLRHKTLKHRLNFGAHTANMAEAGLPGERHLGYYTERARGGAAMIVVEPVPVHRTGVLTRGNFLHETDAIIPAFRTITEACHEFGTVMIQQLYHVGQHGDADNSFEPSWSPSGLPSYHDSDGSKAMTEAEIEELIEAFGQAARRAFEAGFDGVELFAAYHAVIDQFWTPWSNRRDDQWGGSLENRCRFSARIIERIRALVGDDFIVGCAVSMDEEAEAALSMEALQEVVAWHDDRQLVDYFTCGTGSYFDFYKLMPTVFYADKLGAPYAEGLKSVCKHAKVQAESHIRTPENANTVIGEGQADMVSIVRGQIADPHMATKAAEGRPEDIRPCISCNQMCWGRRYRDYWISCLVNPSSGHEFQWGGDRFSATETPRHILVVGAGIAGMEAARVAAERGHRVTLAEAGPELGGQFRLAGLQPRRGQITDLIAWFETQLEKLQVQIRRNTYLEADEITRMAPDAVVLATGSLPKETGFQRWLPSIDPLPGVDLPNVHPVEDVMGGAARPGKRVVMLDDIGHWHGMGTAWHLAEAGHQVTIVTPWPVLGAELTRTTADWPLRRRLKQLGATWHTEAGLKEWTGEAAVMIDFATGEETLIEADALILATTNESANWLATDLAETNLEIHQIGDAVAPRHANMALYEGRKVGRAL